MHTTDSMFPAVLKTPEGKPLADGSANLSLEGRWVEFHGPFVPLFPFGSRAQICLVAGDRETHVFQGEVYLSAQTLLRIVNVDEELLASAELELMQNLARDVALRATVSPVLNEQGILRFATEKLLRFEAEIFSLSMEKMRFVSKQSFDPEERLLVSEEGPSPLKKILVEVRQALLFGDRTGYRCDILSMSEDTRRALGAYLLQAASGPEPGQEGRGDR